LSSVKSLSSKIASLLSGVFLLTILWVFYLLFSLYTSQKNNPVSAYSVPENAEFVVKVDGREVFQQLLLSTFLEGKSDNIIQKLKEIAKKPSSSTKTFGINWTQPITYFKVNYKGQELQGMIVQIINPAEWNKDINTLLGNTSVAKRIDFSGIVVQSTKLSKSDLYEFIEKNAKKSGKEKITESNQPLISISQKGDKGVINLSIESEKNVILMNGIIDHKGKVKPNQLRFVLVPSDLHLTTDLITKDINDSISKYIGINLPLSGISVNYRGIALTEVNGKNLFLPDADFIFGFEKETTVEKLTESIPNSTWNHENQTITIGKQIYFTKQLDSKTIFFGSKQHTEIRENTSAIGFTTKGSLKPLFNVTGNPWIRAAMRMNPISSYGLDFSEEIKTVSIRLEPVNSTYMQLTSSVTFKQEEDAILKLLEIVLKRQ
jgi:hypothetical protein